MRRNQWTTCSGIRTQFRNEHLEIRMFYVGHGELNLIVFPDRRAWIIDVGSGNGWADNNTLGGLIAGYLTTEDLTLDALVMSHAHKDHVGAVPGPAGGRRVQPHPSAAALSQRQHLLEPQVDGGGELDLA